MPEAAQQPSYATQVASFHIAMAVYLLLAYVLAWPLWPLGRDFALLATPIPDHVRDAWPALSMGIYAGYRWFVGDHLALGLALRLGVLYAAMLACFWTTRMVVRGPLWFGSLAATLLMANPLKSEAMLHYSGVLQLGPGVLGLGALWASVAAASQGWLWQALAFFALAGTTLAFPHHAGLPLAAMALLLCLRSIPGAYVVACGALWAVAIGVHADSVLAEASRLPERLWGVWLALYPIGLEPESAIAIQASPWWILVVGGGLLAICGAAARYGDTPAMQWVPLGAVAYALCAGDSRVDPVSLRGGGDALIPCALAGIAVAAACRPIFADRRWTRPIVLITALLCAAQIGLQWRSIGAWRHAAAEVRAVQARAAVAEGDGPIVFGVAFQSYLDAPMELAEAFRYDTAYSEKREVLWPRRSLSYRRPDAMSLRLERVSADAIKVSVDGVSPGELLEGAAGARKGGARRIAVTATGDGPFLAQIPMPDGWQQARWVPYRIDTRGFDGFR